MSTIMKILGAGALALLAGAGGAIAMKAKTQKTIDGLQQNLFELQAKIDEYQRQIVTLQSRVASLQATIGERDMRIAQMLAHESSMQAMQADLNAQYAKNSGRWRRIVAAILLRSKRLAEENQMLWQRMSELDQQMQVARQSRSMMTNEMISLRVEHDQARAEILQFEQSVQRLQAERGGADMQAQA